MSPRQLITLVQVTLLGRKKVRMKKKFNAGSSRHS